MLTLALSLLHPVLAVQQRHQNRTLPRESQTLVDPKVRHVAWQAFAYGEYLSWSRCAKCRTDSPTILNCKAVCWIGDSSRLVKSGFEIKTRIDGILSGGKTQEAKVIEMMEAVEFALDVANTRFVGMRPMKTGYDLLTAAKTGVAFANFCDEQMSGRIENAYDVIAEKARGDDPQLAIEDHFLPLLGLGQ